MNANQRMAHRNTLPPVSIWDFSSSSDEDTPIKKPKLAEVAEVLKSSPEQNFEKEYGPTLKHEVKEINPKLLEHLGYVNRNNRPPSSKRNEILPSLDIKKLDLGPCMLQKRSKEQEKIAQIKLLLESQRK